MQKRSKSVKTARNCRT